MASKGYTSAWAPQQFYYMCHIDNLKSVLEHGILSHNEVIKKGIDVKMISDKDIVGNRKEISVDNKSLWDYSNVYFRVKNAMHYRVMKTIGAENVVILCLKKDILNLPGAKISNGNAASSGTKFFNPEDVYNVLREINKSMRLEWWNKGDESKRQIMAECLVPDVIPPNYITRVILLDQDLGEKVKSEMSTELTKNDISLIPQKDFFNFPIERIKITDSLELIEGDMFFSDCQTLTVSVNTEGVMGKGLASTVKYIVPDVYVKYQATLRTKELKMGKPYYYKRGESMREILGEDKYFLEGENPTSFLIFATKNEWRKPSDFNGMEEGLKYLLANYKKWEIKSLALPALGCGLGWLSWEKVGPMMIKYLSQMDILVEIYLPREGRISAEQKTKEFLLKEVIQKKL